MIARLCGDLAERSDDHVIVDCGGVGYFVSVSGHTLASIAGVGDRVTLRIHTHVQEDRIALYGFASAEERTLFDRLITVKGVGPSLAMQILSGYAPEEIARMIAGEDLAGLTSIKKVGKKVAERLVVELRDACRVLLTGWGAEPRDATRDRSLAPAPERPAVLEEVAAALVHLGWRQTTADKVVDDLPVPADATVEGLLRDALRAMPR